MNTYHDSRLTLRHAMVALSAFLALPVASAQDAPEEERFSVSGAVELGGEYNSNVSVTELETAIGQADVATALEAGINLTWRLTDRLRADGGYSHTATRYQEFSDFDLGMDLFYGDLGYEFDRLSVGTSYYHADAALGGDDFLTLEQYSIYAGRLFGDSVFLRGSINAADKTFDTLGQRDSTGGGFGLDAFWFFNQGRSSLVFGYTYGDEDARQEQFSYENHTFRTSLSNRFTLVGRDSRLQLGLRLQERGYRGVTPAIGVPRDEQQQVAEAEFEVSLNRYFAIVSRLEHGSYQSNLASADYNETRAFLGLKLSFD